MGSTASFCLQKTVKTTPACPATSSKAWRCTSSTSTATFTTSCHGNLSFVCLLLGGQDQTQLHMYMYQGEPVWALLELVDPEQNANFLITTSTSRSISPRSVPRRPDRSHQGQYLDVTTDLSKVSTSTFRSICPRLVPRRSGRFFQGQYLNYPVDLSKVRVVSLCNIVFTFDRI